MNTEQHIAENVKVLENLNKLFDAKTSGVDSEQIFMSLANELRKVVTRNVELAFAIGEKTDGDYQSVPDEIKKVMHDATPFMKERFLIYFMELGRMDVLDFYKHFPQYDPNQQ